MICESVPTARNLNLSAKSRWRTLSAQVRRHVKRPAVVDLALRNQRKLLEPTSNLALLSPLDRIRLVPTFEQEILHAVVELEQQQIYEAQKRRASRKRPKMIGEDDPRPLTGVIAELIHKPENRELSPRELWPHFSSMLRELRCKPMEYVDPLNFRKTKVRFLTERPGSKQKYAELTFARFETIVGGLRKDTSK
jgi:hypothetical protein